MNFTWGLSHSCTCPALAGLRWAQAVTRFSVSLNFIPLLQSVQNAVGFVIWKQFHAHFFLLMQNVSSCQITILNCPPWFSYISTAPSLLQPFRPFAVQRIRHTLSYLHAALIFSLPQKCLPHLPTHPNKYHQVLEGCWILLFLKVSPHPWAGSYPRVSPQTHASFIQYHLTFESCNKNNQTNYLWTSWHETLWNKWTQEASVMLGNYPNPHTNEAQYQECLNHHTQVSGKETKLQISGQTDEAGAAFCNSNMYQQLHS